MEAGQMQQGMQQPAAHQQAGQLAQGQSQQLPLAPQQGVPLPPGQPAGMQQQPPQQQGPPVQMPLGQQQGMPMTAMQGQQPMYEQAATGQPGYTQPVFTHGQLPAYAVQPPAGAQMPAPGQGHMLQQGYMPSAGQDMSQTRAFSTQAPIAGQVPAAAAAAAAAPDIPTSDFSDEWVNCVGLTGTVLHGPFLQQFGAGGKVKASMVLGLLGRTTGEDTADKARPILVRRLLGCTACNCTHSLHAQMDLGLHSQMDTAITGVGVPANSRGYA
jgi:hypothetical protein